MESELMTKADVDLMPFKASGPAVARPDGSLAFYETSLLAREAAADLNSAFMDGYSAGISAAESAVNRGIAAAREA